jgi:F420-dependent oxidoreductase-like protein
MRFGFKTAPQHTTWADMLAVWQAADDIELFESGWNFDHFYPIFSDSTGPCLEAWTMLAAMAQATKRLRLGVMVTGNPYRHPAVLANMVATVDVVSEGRLELGFGAGWNEEEAGAYGISLGSSLTERFDRFDEAIEVIVKLLSEEVADFSGKHYTLTAARCEPKPVQRPHPPILMGGNGPKTIDRIIEYCDEWMPIGRDPSLPDRIEELQERAKAAGRDPIPVSIFGVAPKPEALEELAAMGVTRGVLWLPPAPADDVLPRLRRYAELLPGLPA